MWVDDFGGSSKTFWMSLLNLATLLGIVVGYSITALFNNLHTSFDFITWRFSFYFQIFFLIFAFVVYYFTDERDLATNNIVTEKNTAQNDAYANLPLLRPSFFRSPSLILNMNPDQLYNEEISGLSIEDEVEDRNSLEIEMELNQIKERASEKIEPLVMHGAAPTNLDIIPAMKIFIKKQLYVISMLTLCSLFFIITAIQYWISDYMIGVLHVPQSEVFKLFVIVSLSGPSAGLIIGGKISESLGGYTGKNALSFCLVNAIIASVLGIFLPIIDNYKVLIILIWLELFFGSAIVPNLQGLMITSIPQPVRGLGNSMAQLVMNLFGNLPAPILYGYVVSLDKSIT